MKLTWVQFPRVFVIKIKVVFHARSRNNFTEKAKKVLTLFSTLTMHTNLVNVMCLPVICCLYFQFHVPLWTGSNLEARVSSSYNLVSRVLSCWPWGYCHYSTWRIRGVRIASWIKQRVCGKCLMIWLSQIPMHIRSLSTRLWRMELPP